jgi:predicted dehydrogenase
MAASPRKVTRRRFLQTTAAASTVFGTFTIVPRHVLGQGQVPPSETFGGALIGVGGRGGGTYGEMCKGLNVKKLADCDVKFVDRADNKTVYTDFRRVLDRQDIDLIAIATPPHWHAFIAIAAAQAGKDVLCEKPMTRTISEGRAVVNAFERYNRVFQIGTFGRFGAAGDAKNRLTHKLMRSGLVKDCPAVVFQSGGVKVKEWAGAPETKPTPIPPNLDWDLYCGPSPLKPFTPSRFGGSHRKWWDYDNGGLGDMGQHKFDPINWIWGKDDTSPVEIEAHAPPAHPEATGLWGWVTLKYADGLTIVMDSGEWGQPFDALKPRGIGLEDLSEADQAKLKEMPDPEPLLTFAEAVKQRKRAGGHPEAAHRTVTLLHLANIAIRLGRKLRFDPDKEEFVGDEEANRLANQPMRAPWQV